MSSSGQPPIVPVILSGGSGTRLWPLSRSLRPKQFLNLVGDRSLLQQTAERFAGHDVFGAPIVVCNEEHRFVIAEQLREIGVEPHAIVLEPAARNTAPAIAAAAALVDPDHLMIAVPSDGHIGDLAGYRDSIAGASEVAAQDWIVTFGVEPSRPETGYGYIEQSKDLLAPGIHRIAHFREKPDAATAENYIAQGNFLWNPSLFLFRAGFLLDELEALTPGIVTPVRNAVAEAQRDLDFLRLDADAFGQAPSISIDYALMEKTQRAATSRLASSWSDVGSWQELWNQGAQDQDGNVLTGDVLVEDSRESYVHSEGPLVAALGLENHVVVATSDVVMVAPTERSQEVKRLAERVAREGRNEHELHPRVHRPWGYYEGIDSEAGFQVKRIMVKPGERLSLQRHARRSEHWIIVEGRARVTVDDQITDLVANQSTYVPIGAVHRLENVTDKPLLMIEVQCGDYLGEDDIERLDDDYNRD
ncbi:MAG: mannose-1-phosphate guanylyltransferase/mannose-6-phosphate isomerase [Rhodospirillaceae bacterium]|nr:mannose-1-phosphate guanylyltransferase/mannose-6-phosphate isomerase [Rhodospirillaceae bacterium]